MRDFEEFDNYGRRNRGGGKSSRRHQENKQQVEKGREYPIGEAIALLQGMTHTKFTETVEAKFPTGIKYGSSMPPSMKKNLILPHGLGSKVEVVAVVHPDRREAAEQAGATVVDPQDFVDRVQNDGWTSFDHLVITPDMMNVVGPLARILGPIGKMPSPRGGKMTNDPASIIKELAAGRIELKPDSAGNYHTTVGNIWSEADQLQENFEAVLATLTSMRPDKHSGNFPKKAFLTATMSPSILIERNGQKSGGGRKKKKR